ncbi:MAG: hypothetical protein IKN12_06560 [Selenomonadaceae bacterium]|nr:hypothetical protein [Selenomonadaceae bacterium]MBR3722413.1 hypothetical protein [Selenomonadaceae bacterium]
MSTWRDGMLLAAGGIAGLALAAWLESESESHNYDESHAGKKASDADGMEILVNKIRREAKWAMEECVNDEERQKVYDEVSASIRKLKATLEQRGEEIIADLKEQTFADGIDDDELGDDTVRKFKSNMEDLTRELNEMLESLKPTPAV